jgi:membrane-bound lytic murein transglycosylase D
MKNFFFLILLSPFITLSQSDDNIYEILDSLEKNTIYKNISFENSKKFNFKPGEIPVYTEDEYKERINNLNNYSPFHFSYNKIVRGYINRYLKSPKTVSYILQRSQFYFPLFEKYLNQFQIPLELKNLAIVESALNPTARSHCGAAGLWQFMYGTGKAYHLNVNSLVDERYDPEKETIAACMYLQDLYKIYKDWPLVLAAYNCGPGNVNKAIKKAGGDRNFWAIYEYLPKETQGYVPAFISVCYVTTYYEEHNIVPIQNEMFYDNTESIYLNQRKTLKELSKELKIDYSKLKYLNPQYFTGLVPGINNRVLIPTKETNYIIKDLKNNDAVQSTVLVNSNEPVLPRIEKETPNSVEITKPEKQQVIKNVSKFGSIFNTNSESVTLENNTYSNVLKSSITVLAEVKGTITIKHNQEFEMYNKQAFYINGSYIKEDSKLIAKAFFLNNSIIIEVSIIQAFNKTVKAKLQGEILENQISKSGYIMEQNNTVILKS